MLSKIANFPVSCYAKNVFELQYICIYSNMIHLQLGESDQEDSFAALLIAF